MTHCAHWTYHNELSAQVVGLDSVITTFEGFGRCSYLPPLIGWLVSANYSQIHRLSLQAFSPLFTVLLCLRCWPVHDDYPQATIFF